MAAATDDLEEEAPAVPVEEPQPQSSQTAPVINRSIGSNPIVPSAPADAPAAQFSQPGRVQPVAPGPLSAPGRVPPKPPLTLTADRQENVILKQNRANQNYDERLTRFNAGEMYDKQQEAIRAQHAQEAQTRADAADTYAGQQQEKVRTNEETRNTLKNLHVATETDPASGLVRPARDEKGKIQFREGEGPIAVEKDLHGSARDALGEDIYKSALNLRQLKTTAVSKQQELKDLNAQVEDLTSKAGQTEGGIFGIGKSPTPEAAAAKAKLDEINPQIDALRQAGYGSTNSKGELEDTPEIKEAKKNHAALTADKSAWSQVVPKSVGDLDDAIKERKASILAGGGDPSQDRVLSAIESRRNELGIANQTPEVAQAQAQVAPLQARSDKLIARLESILGLDQNMTAPGGDPDARLGLLLPRVQGLTDPALRGRVQTILSALEPTLEQLRPAKAALQKVTSAVDPQKQAADAATVKASNEANAANAPAWTEAVDAEKEAKRLVDPVTGQPFGGDPKQQIQIPNENSDADEADAAKAVRESMSAISSVKATLLYPTSPAFAQEVTEAKAQAAASVADPSTAISSVREEISKAPDRPIHDVAQKIKGYFYPLFGPNEEQQQHVYNSIMKDMPAEHGLIPSLNTFVSEAASIPNFVRGIVLTAQGKDVTPESLEEYKQQERQSVGLAPSKGDSKPWAATKGIANSLLNAAEAFVNPAFLSLPSSRVLSGVFSAQMLSGVPDAIGRIKAAPDLQGKVEAATDAAVDLLAGGYAAKHAMDASAVAAASRKTWTGSSETADLVQEAIKTAKSKGVSPEFRSFFGGIDPEIAGTTPEKVAAFAKSLGMEWKPSPKPEPSAATSEPAPKAERQAVSPEPPKGPVAETPDAPATRPTTEQAHAEIDGLQASDRVAPEQVAITQTALRGMVKIASGQPMDSLTAAEKQALLKTPPEDGIPRVEMVKGPDGARPVITDAALERARAIAPTVGQLLPENEDIQRQRILSGPGQQEASGSIPGDTGQTGTAGTVGAAKAVKSEITEEAGVNRPTRSGSGAPPAQNTFAVEVQNAKGETKIVEQPAATAEEAKSAVAKTIKPGDGLIRDVSQISQPSKKVSVASGEVGKAVDFVERAVASATEEKGSALTPDEDKQVRGVARVFKPQVERWQKAFDAVTVTQGTLSSGGAHVAKGGKQLVISVPDVLAHAKKFADNKQHAANIVTEEAIHAVTVALEDRDPKTDKARGPVDLVKVYRSLPEKVRTAMKGAYKVKGASDYQYAHEFWRMWMQGDLELQRGNKVRLKGKFLQEQTARAFVVENRKALSTLLRFFRDMSGQLDRAKAGKDVIAEVAKAQDLIRSKVKEVDAHAQPALEKGGVRENQDKTAVSTERPSARGPPEKNEPLGDEIARGNTGKSGTDGGGRASNEIAAKAASGEVEPAAGEKLEKSGVPTPEEFASSTKRISWDKSSFKPIFHDKAQPNFSDTETARVVEKGGKHYALPGTMALNLPTTASHINTLLDVINHAGDILLNPQDRTSITPAEVRPKGNGEWEVVKKGSVTYGKAEASDEESQIADAARAIRKLEVKAPATKLKEAITAAREAKIPVTSDNLLRYVLSGRFNEPANELDTAGQPGPSAVSPSGNADAAAADAANGAKSGAAGSVEAEPVRVVPAPEPSGGADRGSESPIPLGDSVEWKGEKVPLAGEWKTKNPRGPEVFSGKWALVPLRLVDVNTEHGAAQDRINREKTGAAQRVEIINNLTAENVDIAWGASPSLNDGAPIATPEGSIEVGNNRMLAIRDMYASQPEKSAIYEKWARNEAARFGISQEAAAGNEPVVLLRVVSGDRAGMSQRDFVKASNTAATEQRSAAETALSDRRAFGDQTLLNSLDPNEDGSFNAQFISEFYKAVGSPKELRFEDGSPDSGKIERRAQAALLAHLLGSQPGVDRVLSSLMDNIATPGVRQVVSGLAKAGPALVNIEAINPSLSITPNLGRALTTLLDYRRVKDSGEVRNVEDYRAQGQLALGGETTSGSALDNRLLELLANARSVKAVAEPLLRYAKAVQDYGSPDQSKLFGDEEPPDATAILAAQKTVDDREMLWNVAQAGDTAPATPLTSSEIKRYATLYRKLFALEQGGTKLTPDQRRAMEQAEQALGQKVMFGDETKSSPTLGQFKATWNEGPIQGGQVQSQEGLFDERGAVGRMPEGEEQGRLFAQRTAKEIPGQLNLFDRLTAPERARAVAIAARSSQELSSPETSTPSPPQRPFLKDGIKGPSGAELMGYEWRSTLGEVHSTHDGGMVTRRVSDWDNHDVSGPTGRKIVHVYWVKDQGGNITPHGRNAALSALGFSEGENTKLDRMADKARHEQDQAEANEKWKRSVVEKHTGRSVEEANQLFKEANKGALDLMGLMQQTILWEHPDGRFVRTAGIGTSEVAQSDGFRPRWIGPKAKFPNEVPSVELEKVSAPSVDSPAQGALNQAREVKSRTWKKLQDLRDKVRVAGPQAGNLRLELLQAGSAHKDAIRAEQDALEVIERRANELGQTTLAVQPTNDPLFEQGRPLAMQIAKRYSNIRGADADDVQQRALSALARAAEKFDASRGAFLPFARTAINNELRGMYRTGERFREDTTLDAPLNEEGSTKAESLQAPSDTRGNVELAESRRVLDEAVSQLPDRMQGAITGILDGDTLEAIGERLGGISRQAVGRLASEAMRRLRGKLGEKGITSARDLLAQAITDDGRQPKDYERSSTQVTLSKEEARPFIEFGKTIPKNEIFTDPDDPTVGLDDEPHITALYGITQAAPIDAAKAALAQTTGSVTATVGKLSMFKTPKYDVLKADIDSPQLHALNAAMKRTVPFETDFPDYKPHLTIAYLKHGEAAKYVGDPRFEGMQLQFSNLDFRGKDGRKFKIDLSKGVENPITENLGIVEAHMKDAMKAQASADPLQQLIDSLDKNHLEELFDKASAEERGQYTIGRPDLALGAEGPAQRAVDQYYTDLWKPKTRDTMVKEADAILADKGTGFANEIAARWLNGDTLRDSEVMAAKTVLAELSRDGTPEGLQRMTAAGFAYRNIRGQTARDLAAGFDPHKTPEERNREFLTKAISTLPTEKEKQIAAEPDRGKKRALLDAAMKERLEQLEKAFGYISKGGLTLQDVLGGGWELHGKGSKILENQMSNFDVPHQKAVKLAQTGGKSVAEIAKATGLSENEVARTVDEFNSDFRKSIEAKVAKGLTLENIDLQGALLAQETNANAATPQLTPEQIKAETDKIIKGFGFGIASKDLGKFKVVKAKRRKLFVPPKVPTDVRPPNEDAAVPYPEGKTSGVQKDLYPPQSPNEDAAVPYPEGQTAPYTGRVLGQAGLPLYQEMMVRKGADLNNVDDVAKIARVAQAANGNRADMIFEAWISSILSGPTTHFAYKVALAGNAAFEFSIQRGVESLVNTLYRDVNSASFPEFKYILKGLLPGIVKGVKLGARQWSTETELFNQEVMNSQVEMFDDMPATGYNHPPAISETPVQQFFGKGAAPIDTALSKLGKYNPVRGRAIRLPFRLLYFIDGFYKMANAQMAVGQFAYRMARSEGLKGDALSGRINELVATPGSPAWIKAGHLSEWLTFRQHIPSTEEGGNWIDNAVSAVASARNKSHLIGSQIPFVQLPYNIIKAGFGKTFSPITTAYKFGKAAVNAVPRPAYDPQKGAFELKDGKPFTESYSKAAQVRDVATSLIALTTMAAIWKMVAGDGDDDDKLILITGSTPYTQLKKGIRELQQRAYGGSYVLRIGGRNGVHLNFGKFEPFATVLGTLADTIIQAKHLVRGELDAHEALDALAGYFIAQAQEKSFLRGFDNISEVMQGHKSLVDIPVDIVLQGLVPALVRQPLRNLDEYMPNWKESGGMYRLLPSAAFRQPKIDIYGKPVEKTGNAFTRMFVPSSARPYPELQKADRLLLHWNNSHPRDARAPSSPSTTYTDGTGVGKEKTKQMTPEQSTKFMTAAGHRFEQMLRGQITQHQIDHPTEEYVKMIENLHREAASQVKREMFPKNAAPLPTKHVSSVNVIRAWKQEVAA